MKKGFLFIISGPSAVGKTSVANEILKRDKKLSRIVTCATRAMRNGEIDGKDYFFMKKGDFLRRKERGDFAEVSEVYGNYYGVLRSTIEEKIKSGLSALLVVNWEGFLKIKKAFAGDKNIVGFFLTPPSLDDLEKRIRARNADSEEIIRHRMRMIVEDMRYKDEFDFCVTNASIPAAATEILDKISLYESRIAY